MAKRGGSIFHYFVSNKITKITNRNERIFDEIQINHDKKTAQQEEEQIDKKEEGEKEEEMREEEFEESNVQINHPQCWSHKEAEYFQSTYPWLLFLRGKIGCKVCRNVSSIDMFCDHGMHLSKEWVNCQISADAEKSSAQKLLRNKILKHLNSKSHLTANKLLLEKEKEIIKNVAISNMKHHREKTERCMRTAYLIAKEDRPYTDYEALINLQCKNGIYMGRTLHSRWSCTEMIDTAKESMVESLIKEIVGKERKISVIIDEATSFSNSSCLVVYLHSIINESAENVFLDIIELDGQDADAIYNALLRVLEKNKISHDYLTQHFVAFTSDGASVMQGIYRGVATKLKERYPQIILWHCLNHRLELAVSDTVKAVNGVNKIESFFSRMYSLYSQSPKLQRELKEIASNMEVELRKVGRILTTRWVASSFRAVDALWKNYPALCKHFETLATTSTDKASYKGLVNKMQTTQFVEDLAVLKDCLGQLSILSESLQKRDTTIIKACDYVKWTVNALVKIKDSLETKYTFDSISNSPVFKGINLKSFNSRHGYLSFKHCQFLQGLIDNMKSRLITDSEAGLLHDIEALIPEKWLSNVKTPWLEGENSIIEICNRFHIIPRK